MQRQIGGRPGVDESVAKRRPVAIGQMVERLRIEIGQIADHRRGHEAARERNRDWGTRAVRMLGM
jgi:hypothetical protein